MRTTVSFVLAAILLPLAGCEEAAKSPGGKTISGANFFVVNFAPDQVVRYKFTAERTTNVQFGSGKKAAKQKTTETMELVIAYRPIELDRFGYSVIEGRCESVKVTRNTGSKRRKPAKDAVEHLAGKSFTIKITPVGMIEDYSSLAQLVEQLGEKAFSKSSAKRGRIKNPDMIMDFVSTQWFLFDAVSSIAEPLAGVVVGQSWQSKLIAPMPAPVRVGRDVVYTLDEVKKSDAGPIAVIKSEYTLADSAPKNLPVPYSGKFQMRGTFGFLRGYKVLSIKGQGRQLFNMKAGLIESDVQEYTAKVKAALLFGLGGQNPEPNMTVRQRFEMQRLD